MKVWKKENPKHCGFPELIFEEDLDDYVMDKLGITLKPLGGNGVYSQEQYEFLSVITEWWLDANDFSLEDKEYNDQDDWEEQHWDDYFINLFDI